MICFLFEIIKIVFAVSIAVSLFTYALFWYESAARASCPPCANSARCMPFLILRGVLSSILSMLLAMVLYPFGLLRPFWRPKSISQTQPLIILLHGLYHNSGGWLLFRHRLLAAGFQNIYALNYRSFFTSFEATLRKLERFLGDVRREAPDRPVILIGHSLGGLLARAYAERADSIDVPELVLTLGTPHQGSKMAAFGVGRLARSLLFRGCLFMEIEKGPPRLPCPGVALYSPVDNLVLPAEALTVPYPGWLYHETAPVSHVAMLFSKQVARKIVELIREQPGLNSLH